MTPAPKIPIGGEGTIRRSGRVSKPPVRYEPVENVTDDYDQADYDSKESDSSSLTSESGDDDDESDLDGFVVTDKSESDCDDSNGQPPIPCKDRGSKRPTPVGKRLGTTPSIR